MKAVSGKDNSAEQTKEEKQRKGEKEKKVLGPQLLIQRSKEEERLRQLKRMSQDIREEGEDKDKEVGNSSMKRSIVKYPLDYKEGEKKKLDIPLYRSTQSQDYSRLLRLTQTTNQYTTLDINTVFKDLREFNIEKSVQISLKQQAVQKQKIMRRVLRLQERKK